MPTYKFPLTNGKNLTTHGDDPPSDEEVEAAAAAAGVSLQVPDANHSHIRAATFSESHPNLAALGHGVLDSLPGIGAIAGGAGAAVGGPLTAALGAGVGAGGGRILRDTIAESTGIEPPSSMTSKALRVGSDAALTTATEGLLPSVVAALKSPLKTAGEAIRIPAAIRKLLWDGSLAPELRMPQTNTPLLTRPGGRLPVPPPEGPVPGSTYQTLPKVQGMATPPPGGTSGVAGVDWRAAEVGSTGRMMPPSSLQDAMLAREPAPAAAPFNAPRLTGTKAPTLNESLIDALKSQQVQPVASHAPVAVTPEPAAPLVTASKSRSNAVAKLTANDLKVVVDAVNKGLSIEDALKEVEPARALRSQAYRTNAGLDKGARSASARDTK